MNGTATPGDNRGGPEGSAGETLFRLLDELGIRTRTIRHAAVTTVAEAKAALGDIPGAHCKNLFLSNRKRRAWLIVMREDSPLDLRSLAETLGAARLSFGRPDALMEALGVIPGAVSPFAVLNDAAGAVTVVVQRALLAEEALNFHPLDNRLTTAIAPRDLIRFLEATAHVPLILDL